MAADDPRDGGVPGAPYLTTEELRRDVSALREILQARLDGMDRAAVVLSDTVTRTPTAIQTAISHLKELHDEKFSSIELQFLERDVRTNQAATASAQALAAALQAAKEAVFEQAQAAAKAADKTELSFTKQIDLLLAQIKALSDTFTDRLAELKERIDRGEGTATGVHEKRDDQRLSIGQALQALAILLTMVGLIIVAFHK
jgi:ABC-type transporter Mla subunit MlaD